MSEHIHDFHPTGRSYFKQTGELGGLGLPNHDQSVEFIMLYCKQCGETKEIISADHRKEKT